MSAKFTPGPWKLQRDPPGLTTGLRAGEGFGLELARLYTGNSEYIANARLIAAAPEMYEALKNLENDDGKAMPPSAWALVCAALAKAEGKTDV